MTILIVEDNPTVRRLIRRAIAHLTTEIYECGDGADALKAYTEHQPDLVFMDIRMPRMDGLAATRQITKLDRQGQKAILKFLRERLSSAQNLRQWGVALQGDNRGLWRYRVGDYRLICDIQDEKVVVLVLEVGHRKDLYR